VTVNPRAVAVGVDFGTLSGRAVVVRVSDGADLGFGGVRVSPCRSRSGSAGGRSGSAAELGVAGTVALCGRAAERGAGDAADVIGIATDFTLSPRCRSPPTAPLSARSPVSPVIPTPTSSSGNITRRNGRRTGTDPAQAHPGAVMGYPAFTRLHRLHPANCRSTVPFTILRRLLYTHQSSTT